MRKKYGQKGSCIYYIGYDDNDEIIPLIIKLSQMTGYYNIHKVYGKGIYFRCGDDKVLKNMKKYEKELEAA